MTKRAAGNPPLFLPSLVEGRIHIIDVLFVHLVLGQPQRLAETLKMDDFSGSEEPDDVADVRVVGEAEDIVVGHAGFLLWCDLVRETLAGSLGNKGLLLE